MDLRHLRYFIAVAEELNFTRAAARLRVAQPSLSVQIRSLETQIGAELLLREKGRVRLSEAGQVFLRQARKTIEEASRGVELARRAAEGEIGHLTIGYNMPAAYRVFPKIVPAFRRKWPNVHLTFRGLYTPQQLDGVRREELDLGFVWLPFAAVEFDVQELLREPLVAVLPKDHPLAAAARISIKDLSHEPMVLASREADPQSYHQIEQLFMDAGAMLNVAYELENATAMIDFVAMGVGCTLVPNNTCNIEREQVVAKPLRGPSFTKSLAVIKRKDQGGLAQRFFEFTTQAWGQRH